MNRHERRRLAKLHIATMLGQMDAPDVDGWSPEMAQSWVDVAQMLADRIAPGWRNSAALIDQQEGKP